MVISSLVPWKNFFLDTLENYEIVLNICNNDFVIAEEWGLIYELLMSNMSDEIDICEQLSLVKNSGEKFEYEHGPDPFPCHTSMFYARQHLQTSVLSSLLL